MQQLVEYFALNLRTAPPARVSQIRTLLSVDDDPIRCGWSGTVQVPVQSLLWPLKVEMRSFVLKSQSLTVPSPEQLCDGEGRGAVGRVRVGIK